MQANLCSIQQILDLFCKSNEFQMNTSMVNLDSSDEVAQLIFDVYIHFVIFLFKFFSFFGFFVIIKNTCLNKYEKKEFKWLFFIKNEIFCLKYFNFGPNHYQFVYKEKSDSIYVAFSRSLLPAQVWALVYLFMCVHMYVYIKWVYFKYLFVKIKNSGT